MLIRNHEGSKKVRLNVDSLSYWMATNNSRDNVLKYQYFDRYGVTEGLRRLAEKHPFNPEGQSRKGASPAGQTQKPQISVMEGARK